MVQVLEPTMQRRPARHSASPRYPHHLELIGAPRLLLGVGLALGVGAGCVEDVEDSAAPDSEPPVEETGLEDTGETARPHDTGQIDGDTIGPTVYLSFDIALGLRDGELTEGWRELGDGELDALTPTLYVYFFEEAWFWDKHHSQFCHDTYDLTATPGSANPEAWHDLVLEPSLRGSDCSFDTAPILERNGWSLDGLGLTTGVLSEALREWVETNHGDGYTAHGFRGDLWRDGEPIAPHLDGFFFGLAYELDEALVTDGTLMASEAVADAQNVWLNLYSPHYWPAY